MFIVNRKLKTSWKTDISKTLWQQEKLVFLFCLKDSSVLLKIRVIISCQSVHFEDTCEHSQTNYFRIFLFIHFTLNFATVLMYMTFMMRNDRTRIYSNRGAVLTVLPRTQLSGGWKMKTRTGKVITFATLQLTETQHTHQYSLLMV